MRFSVIDASADTQRAARSYSALAPVYDSALGFANFLGTRAAFELLIIRYGIGFHSASDIGCGTGLFACYLSRRWRVPVFGIDRSPEMLRVASRRCPHAAVCFLQQDIRSLHLPYSVDLMTANFDTLNHILTEAEMRIAFRRLGENLTPGGHFVFDLITSCQPLAAARTYTRRLGSSHCGAVQQIRWNPWNSILSISVTIRRPRCRAIVEHHRERAYCPREVSRWLADAGLIIRGVHDAVTLRTATTCSPRVIVVSRKHSN